jgi:hypothetical protein
MRCLSSEVLDSEESYFKQNYILTSLKNSKFNGTKEALDGSAACKASTFPKHQQ